MFTFPGCPNGISNAATYRCLLGLDVDNTVLLPGDTASSRLHFMQHMAPELGLAARDSAVVFVSGNTAEDLCHRLLPWLIEYLAHAGCLYLLPRFHFFVHGGTLHAHFSEQDSTVKACLSAQVSTDRQARQLMEGITDNNAGSLRIGPRFLNPAYVWRCAIAEADVAPLVAILETHLRQYVAGGTAAAGSPSIQLRDVCYGSAAECRATLQLTLKGIADTRPAQLLAGPAEEAPRAEMVKSIRKALEEAGLRYLVQAGGRTSIDIARVDKSYALRYLTRRLDLQGKPGNGEAFGCKILYIGDEVFTGNDHPVTTIPGLTAIAVGPQPAHATLPNVITAFPDMPGPDGACAALREWNRSGALYQQDRQAFLTHF
jgi:hypothetical protein